jgi:hypothetical protein
MMDPKILKLVRNQTKLLLPKMLKTSQMDKLQQKQKKRSKPKSLSQRNKLRELSLKKNKSQKAKIQLRLTSSLKP